VTRVVSFLEKRRFVYVSYRETKRKRIKEREKVGDSLLMKK
jgi:hypothetical protein